ncbi:MAG: gamma-glutamyl-gamma-aminobutyrate hydrolase family protein [Dehalococcoidia bacterium]
MLTPRIAVTTGSENADRVTKNYVDRVIEAGAEPVVVTPGTDVEALLDGVDALLVTGGTDVDPSRFGEDPVPELMTPDLPRDELELSLLRAALRRDMPVLAICRGHQVLNVALGGSLQQHIPGDQHRAHTEAPHDSRYHTVAIEEGSILADLLGPGVRRVNSRHHQAVRPDQLGEGLLPSAMSPDGFVEAMESPTHQFVLAVQWHPERPEIADESRPLFGALVKAAREQREPAR